MNNNFNVEAGKRLAAIRTFKKITLEELSDMVFYRISARSISLFERGLKDIDAVDLYFLCRILEVPIELIFDGSKKDIKDYIKNHDI